MKVLFVATVYHHLTSFHIPYMKYLQNKGFEVWAAGDGDEQIKDELTKLGFRCIDFSFSRSPFTKDNIAAYRQLKKLFLHEDFALVHAHTPVASLLSRMAFRHGQGGKIIYTAHGFHFFKGAPLLNWLIYYQLERMVARWTDRLITINQEDYERAQKMGYRKDEVRYVRGVGVEQHGIQLSNSEKVKLKNKLGLAEDAIVISYIAEINKNKNHQFLLRNWEKIKMAIPKASLLIMGEGDKATEIERLIRDRQLQDVFLLGYRKDVNQLLGITDIVSLLSYREGLPKCIMEAMAVGIPCVVSDTRGLRDLITDGENGFVIPLDDDERLVESFVTVLQDRTLREKMGSVASQKIQPFLLENVLQDYIAIYEEVLPSGSDSDFGVKGERYECYEKNLR